MLLLEGPDPELIEPSDLCGAMAGAAVAAWGWPEFFTTSSSAASSEPRQFPMEAAAERSVGRRRLTPVCLAGGLRYAALLSSPGFLVATRVPCRVSDPRRDSRREDEIETKPAPTPGSLA